jgi:formate dehydrogenase
VSAAPHCSLKEIVHGNGYLRSPRRSRRRISKIVREGQSTEAHNLFGGTNLADPEAIDFGPGALLGSVSGELGLRKFLESSGHKLVVTSDRDGPNSTFERGLRDAEVVISQPFSDG